MILTAERHGKWRRLLTATTTVVAICLGVLVVQSGTANAAAGAQCYSWSGSAPYKSATQVVMFRGYYDIEWCGRGNKVTEFRVIRCEAGSVKGTFVKSTDQDCQPRQALGGPSLRIYGNMWGYPQLARFSGEG